MMGVVRLGTWVRAPAPAKPKDLSLIHGPQVAGGENQLPKAAL